MFLEREGGEYPFIHLHELIEKCFGALAEIDGCDVDVAFSTTGIRGFSMESLSGEEGDVNVGMGKAGCCGFLQNFHSHFPVLRDAKSLVVSVGKHGVGRVIARPFIGEEGNFVRTTRRHDFSILPPEDTMLDVLKENGKDVIGVGKIHDIFAGKGLTSYVYTEGNADGIQKTLAYMDEDFEGLCFVNLVDFDSLYGHRNDIDGYAKALAEFDRALPEMLAKLREDDVLILTADHGCDPAFKGTDHTREYIPLLVYGKKIKSIPFGTRKTYADIGKTICDWLSVPSVKHGESFADYITERE